MTVTFRVVDRAEARDPHLRDELLGTWVAVTDAGGSVGFVAPAPVAEIAAAIDLALARVADGRDRLGVLVADDGAVVGLGLLVGRGPAIFDHWRTVLRVMVHPDHQGRGAGRTLVEGLHDAGRSLGLEHLQLTVRGGEGLEAFYARFGYEVVGLHPGAVRVAPGDDRDELMLVARLA